ncbi:LysR family transcriptional regulator [Achromobacter xylosoxidans]|uniref:LysR family transcriptional regulator n=1 Tax=Achromobacter TaxID=222 RepID=UPI0006C51EB1|nr:LysR family transcriptional regulator [Achromobacter xylosoxidans]OFQ42498.1 transcriptional regulator [Achromobacter xylosoxidans]QQE54614.1 LysR family transcriptional regulator [Achromobacter xylosoxidans]QQV14256.1 LysR family transcriptional regulator [Achromobacter xylosoxidans]UXL04294.1 LysR family transcriptional regulator [Achromobacter xylosoxidans]CUI69385.1 Quorum-sensing regulator protein D [Achromobacter xylosoxidans]
MIDLVALKDFLVLCQLRSFSRASERCHVSVSGLSRRIQGLEQWLGVPLFDRRKAALEPTDAGLRLQAVATEVVYALEGLRKSVRTDARDRQQRIRFCAPHIMSAVFFPDWIPRLHSDFRDAKFSVESDNLPECLALLDEGAADYAVALFDAGGAVARRVGLSAEGGGLRWLGLGGERLVPVSAPNAAGRPLYDLARADGQAISFLGYADECHLGWSLRPLLDGLDLDLQQSHNASLTDGLRLMALSGLGVAWLPLSLVRGDLDARKLVRAGGAAFEVPLRLRLLRGEAILAEQAERLWQHLQALARPAADAPLAELVAG